MSVATKQGGTTQRAPKVSSPRRARKKRTRKEPVLPPLVRVRGILVREVHPRPELTIITGEERDRLESELVTALGAADAELRELRLAMNAGENYVYRFYAGGLKTYDLQALTLRAVEALRALLPGSELNAWFLEIVAAGTGKKWKPEHSQRWTCESRPILEGFFHARHMIDLCLTSPRPNEPPTRSWQWANLLHLFNLR